MDRSAKPRQAVRGCAGLVDGVGALAEELHSFQSYKHLSFSHQCFITYWQGTISSLAIALHVSYKSKQKGTVRCCGVRPTRQVTRYSAPSGTFQLCAK